jgi:hypothetical protein
MQLCAAHQVPGDVGRLQRRALDCAGRERRSRKAREG